MLPILVTAKTSQQTTSLIGLGSSIFGCPNTWRVRVRTANNLHPTVKVFGTITYVFSIPGPALVDIPEIDSLAQGHTTTRHLDLAQLAGVRACVGQRLSGTFELIGYWVTDFSIVLLASAPVTASLLRADGAAVASGYGYTATCAREPRSPTLSFKHDVASAADIGQLETSLIGTDTWDLRIKNEDPLFTLRFLTTNLFGSCPRSKFRLGCFNVGTVNLTPYDAIVAANEKLDYSFTWTVPAPLTWRDLQTVDLRFRDEQDVILLLRFDAASQTFSVFNEASGRFERGFAAGSPNRLQTTAATVHLADSSVVGSGPTGQSLLLHLSLSFNPHMAGRSFLVEAAASDNLGNEQDAFGQTGRLTVSTEH
jgi:hypothetical protein